RGGDAGQIYCDRGAILRRVVVDHAVFVRAEAAYAALVEGSRYATDRVAQVRGATCRVADSKIVTALGVGYGGRLRQCPVNQASTRDDRAGSRTTGRSWRPERSHGGRIAGCRIGRKEADLTGVGGTNGAGGR